MAGYEEFQKAMHKHRDDVADALARAMHEYVCGSWDAAGYDVQVAFKDAGHAAYEILAKKHGFDLFALRDGGWGLVT